MQNCIFVLIFSLLITNINFVNCCGRGSITIDNNEYSGVLIAIAEGVPENPSLLQRICDTFIEASQALYLATRQRAYLANITVLVPQSWSANNYTPATDQTLEKSNIVIESSQNGFNTPFVIKATPCGEPGYYMHLTPEYLLDESIGLQFGPYGKVLVHEWAHLRYGVFDEYPLEGSPLFYASSQRFAIQPVRCSSSINGRLVDVNTGGRCRIGANALPVESCRFEEVLPEGDSNYASIMYKTKITQLSEFCDDDENNSKTLHDIEAPTAQNTKCGGRSVWQVIREHPDFANQNPAASVDDVKPTFTFVQAQRPSIVLVLDVSASMKRERRVQKLAQGCSNFISTIIEDGNKLGIVWFNNAAVRKANITVIDNSTRQELLDYIPRPDDPISSTSIASGLLEAFAMLEDEYAGTVIVVSDGEETDSPRLEDIAQEIRDAPVTIHSIAVTDAADRLLDVVVAQKSGLSFIYTGAEDSNALNQAFVKLAGLSTSPYSRIYTVDSRTFALQPQESLTTSVSVDSSLGSNTRFLFDYSHAGIGVTVTSPSGLVFLRDDIEVDHDIVFGVYRFSIPNDRFVPGEWQYELRNLGNDTTSVAVSVTSSVQGEQTYPITAHTFWGTRIIDSVAPGQNNTQQVLYAAVSQGYSPVLYADVVALVESTTGNTVNLTLLDNGAGADVFAGDGIYSAYFTQIDSGGRYGVHVEVNSNAATIVSSRRLMGQYVSSDVEQTQILDNTSTPISDLQRTELGQSFMLQNYTPGQLYAPARIHDLQVTTVNVENYTVILTWTAVGSQLDHGRASAYELRFAHNAAALLQNFDAQEMVTPKMVVSGTTHLLQPKNSMELEEVTIELQNNVSETFFFAIISKDYEGRNVSGPLSNIVSASFVGTLEDPYYNNDDFTNSSTYALTKDDGLSAFAGAFIVGGVILAICASVLTLVLVNMEFKHKGSMRESVSGSTRQILQHRRFMNRMPSYSPSYV